MVTQEVQVEATTEQAAYDACVLLREAFERAYEAHVRLYRAGTRTTDETLVDLSSEIVRGSYYALETVTVLADRFHLWAQEPCPSRVHVVHGRRRVSGRACPLSCERCGGASTVRVLRRPEAEQVAEAVAS